ncbi:uncharacterized protein EV422DRAFT_599945 [Fimicolochytrium jonesii]|uniref:uncharacterized protein n=1 Tax=Fimicolochytrium jonesii TaxID=1396493 RepID=UPI0022FE8A41|nr:uncharacterized protein EV422DRAFT_599945 [Fimicolochytrium jonesii]KAI8825658.1 hypothetical protein EV422DRAFT_599945 [Fimicolochytrium jonesii]
MDGRTVTGWLDGNGRRKDGMRNYHLVAAGIPLSDMKTKQRNESEWEGKRTKRATAVHGFSHFNTLLKQDGVGTISRFNLNVESAEEYATAIAHPDTSCIRWVNARRKHLYDQLGAGEKEAIEGIRLSPTPTPTPAHALDALLSTAKHLLTYADSSIEFGLFTFDHTTECATATGTSPMLCAMLSDGSAKADNVCQRIETHFRTLGRKLHAIVLMLRVSVLGR